MLFRIELFTEHVPQRHFLQNVRNLMLWHWKSIFHASFYKQGTYSDEISQQLTEFIESTEKLCARYDYEVKHLQQTAEVDFFDKLAQLHKQTSTANNTISLVTHLTMSRFDMLQNVTANWKGKTYQHRNYSY